MLPKAAELLPEECHQYIKYMPRHTGYPVIVCVRVKC